MMTRRAVVAGGAAAATVILAAEGRAAHAAGPSDVLDGHDALGLAALVRQRKVSPTELLDAAIARAEAINPRLNFIAQRHYDFARRAIANGLPQGPFTGVPWLLKDLNTYIAGELSEGGSRFYRGFRASVTSELVLRHQRAGFVIFGKTTVPEFGLTGTTENKLTGDTRNPWDSTRIAGGSSGGAAVAVAAGVVPAAHATDGGGSIRIPASCCGLFGLKPSRGRVPMGPIRTEGWGGFSTHHGHHPQRPRFRRDPRCDARRGARLALRRAVAARGLSRATRQEPRQTSHCRDARSDRRQPRRWRVFGRRA